MGFAEIMNNRVSVLVNTAERPEDIDVKRAEEAKERAEERLRQKQSIQEYHLSQASLARAMARLKASRNKHGIYRADKRHIWACCRNAACLFAL